MDETIKRLHELADFNFSVVKLEWAAIVAGLVGWSFWYCFWRKDKDDK